jgi:hypothetical membrane protein
MPTHRVGRALGVAAPIVAAGLVLAGGWMTPGYDPLARTISRLAEPGLPGAFAVEMAIGLVGVALLALSIHLGSGSRFGRALLAVGGVALLAAAVIRLDPESTYATTAHRVTTLIAILALAGAPFAFTRYGRVSVAIGLAEVGMLLVGLALLPTSFAAWGAWERCFLALPMAWMVWVTWTRSASMEDTMKADAASHSSSGS